MTYWNMFKIPVIYLILIFMAVPVIRAQPGNTDYQYALIEAVKQKNLGNLPGAIELYRMVLDANDSVAVAHYELGTLLILVGQKDEGVEELSVAYCMDPGNTWYRDSYIDGLLVNEDFKTAEKTVKSIIKKEPENVAMKFKRANVLFLAGKAKKAVKILNHVEKEYGISEKVSRLKATILEKEEEYGKALSEVEVLISLFPESVEYRLIAAELAMQAKKEGRAVEYYLDVMDLDSTNIFAITNLADYYRKQKDFKESFYYLNKSFKSEEIDYDRKLAILSFYLTDQEFLNEYPSEIQSLIETMLEEYPEKKEIHLYAADFYVQQLDYKKALTTLEPVLLTGEKRYEIWKQALILASATGNSEEVARIAARAVSVFPDSLEIYVFKGSAEYELEEYEAVTRTFTIKDIDKFRETRYYEDIQVILAESYYQLKEYSRSDSLFRIIIKENPENYLIKNNFAYYLSLRNESLEEAKELSYSTIQEYPDNATYLDTYAWILFKMENFSEAKNYIEHALQSGGENDQDILEHAADIFMATGDFERAKTYYEKAIINGGNKERIQGKMVQIEDRILE